MWARSEVELSKPPKGSKTPLKDHLMQVYKVTGKLPQKLADRPPLETEMRYIVDWYLELQGVTPLTFTEIKSWAEMTHNDPLPWEVEVIMKLDKIYWEGHTDV